MTIDLNYGATRVQTQHGPVTAEMTPALSPPERPLLHGLWRRGGSGWIIALISAFLTMFAWGVRTDFIVKNLRDEVLVIKSDMKTIEDGRVNSLGKQVADLAKMVREISNLLGQRHGKDISFRIEGMVGVMNPQICEGQTTSLGVSYHPNHCVCEVNESYYIWSRNRNLVPILGHFLEIENQKNKMRTWCMVIGTFNDVDYPKRMLIVSDQAASKLGIKKGLFPASVRPMSRIEWMMKEKCLYLFQQVYDLGVKGSLGDDL